VRYLASEKVSHIRPLDARRDLSAVADLMELCFSSTLDPDGREYLRHIRQAAADPALVRWTFWRGERISSPLFGFVWEQDHRLVGNLSLIPIAKGGKWIFMIANVAVHPDYRRRGIARELTLRALEYIRERGVKSAWLQVRDDNAPAYNLYASVGFIERSRRSTWLSNGTPDLLPPVGVEVGPREPTDWPLQRRWLELNYPSDTTWNMSFEVNHFHPAWWNRLWMWLNGNSQLHWAARYHANGRQPAQTLGFASWEPIRGFSDMLWVASPPEHDDAALRALLPAALHHFQYRHRPVSVNYPFGRGVDAFQACQFSLQNTLVWMEYLCRE